MKTLRVFGFGIRLKKKEISYLMMDLFIYCVVDRNLVAEVLADCSLGSPSSALLENSPPVRKERLLSSPDLQRNKLLFK